MDHSLQVLWGDGERVLFRGSRPGADGELKPVLTVLLAADRPSPPALERLAHEYELRNELDRAWAARPLELAREAGRAMLVLEDQGGEPLARLLGQPMETGVFLRLGIDVAAALGKAHQAGLVHKDLKPDNILITREGREAFAFPRIDTPHTHGTGCTYATAIAIGLAEGRELEAAVTRAVHYLRSAIETAPGLGRGHGPLNHMHGKGG